MSKQITIKMYSHLYGKEVTMDDRFETKVIWSEELAIKNNGKWIPKEITMSKQTEVTMTIKQWLQNVHYDDYGQYLWANHDDGNQLIGEVRGWGALQQEFKTEKEAEAFQDEVGKFIADAINEKIKRDFGGEE